MGFFFGTLFLALGALELGLRKVGSVIQERQTRVVTTGAWHSMRDGKDDINILAMGDSFTFGGKHRADESYPSKLATMLEREYPGVPFHVVNAGICEIPSARLLEILPSAVSLNHPDIIVLLVGAANLFDPYANWSRLNDPFRSVRKGIFELRLLKMARFIHLEASQRYHAWFEPVPDRPVSLLIDADPDPEFAAALERMKGLEALRPDEIRQTCDQIKTLYLAHPGEDRKRALLSCLYKANYLVPPHEAVFFALETIRLEGVTLDNQGNASRLMNAFSRQSTYSADRVHAELAGILDEQPHLRRNPRIVAVMESLKDWDQWEASQEEWLIEDLEAIYRFCEDNQISLVLQNYPHPYEVADRAISTVAARHGIPLVDNGRTFRAAVKETGGLTWPYIDDDTHCTPWGHELMAQGVLQVLDIFVLDELDLVRLHQGHEFRARAPAPRKERDEECSP